jgi:hypothetical protein
MTKNDYIDKITQNLEHLTKDELKDVSILTTAQYGVRLKVAEKEYIEKEIANLTPKLQQQALPVVPECVAEDIEKLKSFNKDGKNFHVFDLSYYSEESVNWVEYDYDNYVKFYLAVATGKYEVEKPQLFYLKNKLTTSYLILDTSTGYFEHWGSTEATGRYKSEFTQAEIDSMHAESYEQIEVSE